MTAISFNTSKISVPASLTSSVLFVSAFEEQNQLPSAYYPLAQFRLKENVWEDQYLPTKYYDLYADKMMAIQKFALNLLQESENIPEEFARVINEDFWEII